MLSDVIINGTRDIAKIHVHKVVLMRQGIFGLRHRVLESIAQLLDFRPVLRGQLVEQFFRIAHQTVELARSIHDPLLDLTPARNTGHCRPPWQSPQRSIPCKAFLTYERR